MAYCYFVHLLGLALYRGVRFLDSWKRLIFHQALDLGILEGIDSGVEAQDAMPLDTESVPHVQSAQGM